MLAYEFDAFDGVIITRSALPDCHDAFSTHLSSLIYLANQENKRLIWLTLPIEKSHFVHIATQAGFVYHNCLESELTLILRLVPGAYAPFVPTYSLGAGALITNDKGEILVIREAMAQPGQFKLPGGHIELGEDIATAIEREVEEETGVIAHFSHILGFATKHEYRFGKSNAYFVCALKASRYEINIQDTNEIAEAKWMCVEAYQADPAISAFNRYLVAKLCGQTGLAAVPQQEVEFMTGKREVFFARP